MKNQALKRLTILLFGLFILTGLIAQKPDNKYKPKNLDEAISQLDILLTEKDKKDIYDMTEKDYTTNSHFSTGMWIRNNWGLWGGQELAKYFNGLGIYHPDDMSGIILCSYYRHIHNQDYKLEEQIKYYQDYWKKSQELGQRLKTDTAFARQERIKFEESMREKKEKQKQSFPIGSKIKAWVEYNSVGNRTEIIGTVIEWRYVDEKGKRLSTDGTYFKLKDVEAKIKVIEFIDKKKKNQVEKQNQMTTDELWVNIGQLEKQE
ncbi:DUF6794 domain-containing protein [Parabacteroides sp. FAFU027]|uniref:DUF6794 domain-containing protein n=1 Tax=Parabacteroides sp. FAFU027 TaxID=2922715 RepID=UPI001FAF11A8|nr:DUF6794 domain-containing protein [Parabacteroides sp. FAFU027]